VRCRAWERAPRAGAASSSITKAPSARTAGTSGRWRGEISKGFWPDGRRRRHKASGRTKQDVIDALKRKAGPAPVGPVSCVYRIDARHVNRDADLAFARDRIGGLSQLQLAPGHRTH
jgi:hypothetical protein